MATHLTKQILTLTEAAASKIRHQLDQSRRAFLSFRVKPRGCSGLMYSFEFADEKGKLDEVVEDKGVKILVDSKTMMHVIGTKMDFVDDNVRARFIFENPNVRGHCGCGESFLTTSIEAAAARCSSTGTSLGTK